MGAQALQSPAHARHRRFVGDNPLLETDSGCQFQGPEATVEAKVAGTAVQECFQLLGRFDREGGSESMGTRRTLFEHGESGCVEAFDRIANGLVVATQVRSDRRCTLATGGSQQDLAASQHEGIRRTQSRLDLPMFVLFVSGRIKMGAFMPLILPHFLRPFVRMH